MLSVGRQGSRLPRAAIRCVRLSRLEEAPSGAQRCISDRGSRERGISPSPASLCAAFDNLFHLAAADTEFASYRSLAVTCAVPRPHRLLQRERRLHHPWLVVHQRWRTVVLDGIGISVDAVLVLVPDEQHEEFERSDQRQGRPDADHGTYRAVSQAVRQVGTDCGHDARAEAPRGQPWYTLVPPARVQHHHGRRPDQTIYRERQQPGSHARFAVRADE